MKVYKPWDFKLETYDISQAMTTLNTPGRWHKYQNMFNPVCSPEFGLESMMALSFTSLCKVWGLLSLLGVFLTVKSSSLPQVPSSGISQAMTLSSFRNPG